MNNLIVMNKNDRNVKKIKTNWECGRLFETSKLTVIAREYNKMTGIRIILFLK